MVFIARICGDPAFKKKKGDSMRNANKAGVIDYEKKAIREFDSYGKKIKKNNF